jgi:hypothetical protein
MMVSTSESSLQEFQVSQRNLLIALLPVVLEHLREPRVLAPQTLGILSDEYASMDDDSVTAFLQDKLWHLQDYEQDLLLSPTFTPALPDRLRYMRVLQGNHLSSFQLHTLGQQVMSHQPKATVTTQGGSEIPFFFPEVTVERFIKRLFLDKPIVREAFERLHGLPEPLDKPVYDRCLLQLRDPIWQSSSGRGDLLSAQLLPVFIADTSAPEMIAERLEAVTDFVRTYRPKSIDDLTRQLAALVDSVKKDLDNIHNRGLFDDQLKVQYSDPEVRAHFNRQETRQQYDHWLSSAEDLLRVLSS